MSKKAIQRRVIVCKLTDRPATISNEVTSIYGEGPMPEQTMESHFSCESRDARCPKTCIYLGGNVDPETGLAS
jgi:hypothetical protein